MNTELNTTKTNAITTQAKVDKLLRLATKTLFGVAVVGQLFFVMHIVTFYGSSMFTGNYENWNTIMYNGLIEGDIKGNFALVIHVFLAAIITFGGPLQFIPSIRKAAPKFHRWNGRIYIITAFLISLAGLYMVHTRNIIGGNIMTTGNTINATLIIIFAGLTWRTAISKDFVAHRRWAIRTFLVVSGVWFFRIGFGLWIFLNMGTAPGSTENLTGPFDHFLAFAHTLLPLAILEIYFFVKERNNPLHKRILAVNLFFLSAMLGAGIFMATMIFWLN